MRGLVLEGGGAKGAFQIGSFKALKELGIDFAGIAGTSIGALNGSLITQGDEDRAYEVWANISTSRLFQLSQREFNKLVNLDISSSDIPFFLGKIKAILKNKGLDISLVKNLLQELIDEEKIRKSKIDFGLVTYSLSEMKPYELLLSEIPKGKLIDYLMASASFPIFKLEKLDGKLFVDGGVFDNMPINLLIKKGFKEITVIRTHGIGVYKKVIDSSVNITYINPSEDLGGVLDFDNKKANYNLKLGYYDTMKIYKNWKGKVYFIQPEKNDDRIISFLLAMKDETIEEVGQIFGFTKIPSKRMLFEFILPRISDLLGLPKESSYQDIVINLSEEIAKETQLDRFQVYTFDSFIKEISLKYKLKKKNLLPKIPSFVKQNELLSHFVSDSIFKEIASKVLVL